MVVAQALFTRREYDLLPEGFPAQLVGGHLVREPSPTYGHSYFGVRIVVALARVVDAQRVAIAPVDVAIDEWNVYQPDVAVYARPLPEGARATETPIAVFEILSPSTRRRDAGVKRRGYLRRGIEEVWLVDREAGCVEVHRRAGVETASGSTAARSAAVPGFELVPALLFRDANA